MFQPVWVLSVDLQTKTATFTTGLADAARKAKGSFNDIRNAANEANEGASKGFGDIRHSLGLLDNSIRGAHGAAMADAIRLTAQWVDISGALPFAAMAGGILLVGDGAIKLAQAIREAREEEQRYNDEQRKFQTGLTGVFNALDKKLLQVEIRSDELNKDHLAALKHQLELIDLQSMSELIRSFQAVDKQAEDFFKNLEGHWYSAGIGSAGAKNALEEFEIKYESLLSKHQDKDASDLLAGTLQTARKVLAAQQLMAGFKTGHVQTFGTVQEADAAQFAATRTMSDARVGFTENEIRSQEALIATLLTKQGIEERVSKTKGIEKGNATTSTGNAVADESFRNLKAQFDAERKGQEEEERLQDQARTEAIQRLQQTEREKIAATQEGSRERLAAIDASIKEENSRGLQETGFYRSLLTSRVDLIRQMAQEEARIKEEAGREDAAHSQKMAELAITAQREQQQLENSARRVTAQERAAQEAAAENALYALKLQAFDREIQALDKHGKDYANKLKTLQDREKELTQQHENKLTEIKDKAEQERNARILSAEQQFDTAFAQSLTTLVMRHQSTAQMLLSIGDQIATGMLENAIKSMLMEDMTKERDAAHAARKAYNAGLEFPFPVNLVMAPTLAAGAFAAVMAFNKGTGMVPGVTNYDSVPAILTPGESVNDRELTTGLRGMVRNGNSGNHTTVHLHYRPNFQVSTINGDGIRGVLREHADEFNKHFHSELRKLNR